VNGAPARPWWYYSRQRKASAARAEAVAPTGSNPQP
jgi:hypothetical protein